MKTNKNGFQSGRYNYVCGGIPTLPLKLWWLPSRQLFAKVNKLMFIKRLGENIGRLFFSGNVEDGYSAVDNFAAEVVIFEGNVFGARAHAGTF